MTPDEYLRAVLRRITSPTGSYGPGPQIRAALLPTIRRWATTQLVDVFLSGSYAKGTAIMGGTDVDLFVSLKEDTRQTLKEIFDSLAVHLGSAGYAPRKQNVSIGITHGNCKVDVVPGKRQQGWSSDHSLWVSRQNTWQKTNVSTHVQTVTQSGKADVIRLMKRWKQLHTVEVPSFALELAVLKALNGRYTTSLAAQVLGVLEFLRDRLQSAALIDPANTNNNVADELTATETQAIARQAAASRNAASWEEIVW